MSTVATVGVTVLVIVFCAAALGALGNARDAQIARNVRDGLHEKRIANPEAYDPAMTADLPEVARRYFASAIAPGTPLQTVVELDMEGEFILNRRAVPMRAEQIIAPPHGFVWRARMGGGVMRFAGSDGYEAGVTSWTRFWLLGLVPLARVADTGDHARAAAARMAIETVWSPAALLPGAGAVWRQVAPDQAEISFPEIPGIEPIAMTLDNEGRVSEIVTQRWSDANPAGVYRLQPFGGRMLAHATFQGFTVPTRVEVGNHFGTQDYAPFFRATVTQVRY